VTPDEIRAERDALREILAAVLGFLQTRLAEFRPPADPRPVPDNVLKWRPRGAGK